MIDLLCVMSETADMRRFYEFIYPIDSYDYLLKKLHRRFCVTLVDKENEREHDTTHFLRIMREIKMKS